MSGTSALLNLLEGSGSALLNAPEPAQNGVSEADSSHFVSLMKQYEGPELSNEAVEPQVRDPALELLGNGLPIPVATPVILPAVVETEADTRLEEFAVGLGIDRELARLLLRETAARPVGAVSAPPSVSTPPSEPAPPSLGLPEAQRQAAHPMYPLEIEPRAERPSLSVAGTTLTAQPLTARPLTAPAPVSVPPSVSITSPASTPPSLSLPDAQRQSAHPMYPLEIEPRAELPSLSVASTTLTAQPLTARPLTAPAPVSVPPSVSIASPASTPPSLGLPDAQRQSAHPMYPLEIEPRAELPSLSVAGTTLTAQPLTVQALEVQPQPAVPDPIPRATETPLVVPGNAMPALRDEDVLRWRAFIHRSSSGLREPAQELAMQAASDGALDPASGIPRRGLSEVDFAAATASLRGFALERRQILTSTVTPVSSAALTEILPGDSPVNPAALAAVLPATTTVLPSAPMTTLADPLTTPLRVPDPALQHELRAEQFAEQVGRRMLQQIREDRWTVNLQLDPQRLGPMEIELQLEGNQVTAQVGVANAEVRHLLESALPKLRESLDSAGLNLANWSFAQSGARDFREFAQHSAAAAAKAASRGTELASEDEVPRRMTAESASRVVDVYV